MNWIPVRLSCARTVRHGTRGIPVQHTWSYRYSHTFHNQTARTSCTDTPNISSMSAGSGMFQRHVLVGAACLTAAATLICNALGGRTAVYWYFGTQFVFAGTMAICLWDTVVEGAKRPDCPCRFCRWSQNAELWALQTLWGPMVVPQLLICKILGIPLK